MKPFPVSLERYFFTTQSVIANPDHDVHNDATKFHLKIENNVSLVSDKDSKYGIEVTISLDQENSINPPYDVNVTAFGVIQVIDITISQEQVNFFLQTSVPQMMIGVIRERIAEMTSRGPWPTTHLNFIPIGFNQLDEANANS